MSRTDVVNVPRPDWYVQTLKRHRDGDIQQKTRVEEDLARIICAGALGWPLVDWGNVADAIHLAKVLRLRDVVEDVRRCPAGTGSSTLRDAVEDARDKYLRWYDSTARDITEHHGEPDLAYIQRKLSLASDMALAIRRFLDRVAEHRQQGEACPACKTSRLRKLRKALENYLNCDGYTR